MIVIGGLLINSVALNTLELHIAFWKVYHCASIWFITDFRAVGRYNYNSLWYVSRIL